MVIIVCKQQLLYTTFWSCSIGFFRIMASVLLVLGGKPQIPSKFSKPSSATTSRKLVLKKCKFLTPKWHPNPFLESRPRIKDQTELGSPSTSPLGTAPEAGTVYHLIPCRWLGSESKSPPPCALDEHPEISCAERGHHFGLQSRQKNPIWERVESVGGERGYRGSPLHPE